MAMPPTYHLKGLPPGRLHTGRVEHTQETLVVIWLRVYKSWISAVGPGSAAGGQTELMPRAGLGANLDDTGHMQLGGFQAKTGIDSTEQQDGENNGKVSHQGPDLQKGDEQLSRAPPSSRQTQSLGSKDESGQEHGL